MEKSDRGKSLLEAKGHFSKAIQLDETYVKPVYQRMTIYREMEDYEEALQDAKTI